MANVSDIAGLGAAYKDGSTPANATPKPHKLHLDANDFMKLFIKSMTTQNPLKPMDNSSMLSQMADMSAIETAGESKKMLADLKQSINVMLGGTQFLGASQLIGKKVETIAKKSQLADEKEGLDGAVILPAQATDVKVTIKDAKGNVVKEIPLATGTDTGWIDFHWDGLKPNSTTEYYDKGYYQISASATIDGKATELDTAGAFKVRNVSTNPTSGDVYVNTDEGSLFFKNIIKIL